MAVTRSLAALIAALICSTSSAPASGAERARPTEAPGAGSVQIPSDLAGKLQALPQNKRDFITSGKTREFMPPRVMFERFRARTPAEIEAIVDAMMSVTEQMAYREGRDPASIPLDTGAEAFNVWKTQRPPVLDPKREPGPFSLQRYLGRSGNGFATFAGAPIALTPEDLRAG